MGKARAKATVCNANKPAKLQANYILFRVIFVVIIEDSFTINAPIQEVWDYLLDIEQLATCVPGVEHIEQTGDNTYDGTLVARVGPISASFSGTAEITKQVPPSNLEATFKAKDKRTASMVKGAFTSELIALSEQETEVKYKVDVAIRGRMGQFGQTIIVDTAKSLTEIFVNNLRGELEKPAEGEAAQEVQPAKEQPNLVWVVISSVFASITRSIRGMFQRS